jgi:transposase
MARGSEAPERAPSSENGPTARPEAEQAERHSPEGAEGSRSALGNIPQEGDQQHPDDGALSGASPLQLTRASSRFRFRMEDLGEDRPRVVGMLYAARRQWAQAQNMATRIHMRGDTEALDAYWLEHGEPPKKAKQWPFYDPPKENSVYKQLRKAFPEMPSGMAASAARLARSKWRSDRYDVLVRCTKRPRHERETGAFSIRRQDWSLTKQGNGWFLSFPLQSGGGDGRVRISIDVRDAYQRNLLEQLLLWKDSKGKPNEGWEAGDLKIEQDRKRPSKWYARISYKRLVPVKKCGKAAAVHRGIRNHLVAVIEGERKPWVVDGAEIEAYLKQYQRRRREYQNAWHTSGRKGRGRKVALRPTEPLQGKVDRWRRSTNQRHARRLVEWLVKNDVRVLFIEDLSSIRDGEPERLEGGEHVWKRVQEWPFYDVGTRIESCANEAGIVCKVVSAGYISTRCPSCETVSDDNRDLRRWRMRCECGYKRDLDQAAAENVLTRGLAVHEGTGQDFKDLARNKRANEKTARKRASRSSKTKGNRKNSRKG